MGISWYCSRLLRRKPKRHRRLKSRLQRSGWRIIKAGHNKYTQHKRRPHHMDFKEYKAKVFAERPEVKEEYDALAPHTRSFVLKLRAAEPSAWPKNSWQRKWGRHRPISPDLKAEPTTLPGLSAENGRQFGKNLKNISGVIRAEAEQLPPPVFKCTFSHCLCPRPERAGVCIEVSCFFIINFAFQYAITLCNESKQNKWNPLITRDNFLIKWICFDKNDKNDYNDN